MKIFTEEQVREVVRLSLEDAETSVIWSKEWYPQKLADKILQSIKPIELPTDEEIKNESDSFYSLESYNLTFERGAKYVINKIQGGNK